MRDRTYKNDTALIEAALFAEDGVSHLPASAVAWTIRKPDGTLVSGTAAATETNATVAFTDTALPGNYNAQVTFTLAGGNKRSTVHSFEVVDPLESTHTQDANYRVLVGEDYEIPLEFGVEPANFWYTVEGGPTTVVAESLWDNVTGALVADPNGYWNGETVTYAISFVRGGYETVADPVLEFVVPAGQRVELTFPSGYTPDHAVVYRRINGGDWMQILSTGGQVVQPDVVPPNDGTAIDPIFLFGDTSATLRLSHSTPGLYKITATYLYGGDERGQVFTVKVVDPYDTSSDSVETVVDRAWMKLEDLFDSELGGPHLRDRTLAIFDREKMKRMLPDALYNVNNYFQPATGYTETSFPAEHQPLLSQALLVESIYHLMRSYTEQPQPMGAGTPTYFDRRDYTNRWKMILDGEEKRLNMWLDLFKRGEMAFGQSSLLVGGYASYGNKVPRYMRGRYPYIYRW